MQQPGQPLHSRSAIGLLNVFTTALGGSLTLVTLNPDPVRHCRILRELYQGQEMSLFESTNARDVHLFFNGGFACYSMRFRVI